jgi:hypothetical protein
MQLLHVEWYEQEQAAERFPVSYYGSWLWMMMIDTRLLMEMTTEEK